jgi:hypothetical protein
VARRPPKYGFKPGDLVHAKGRGFGLVVASLPYQRDSAEDGVDCPEWEWSIVINQRLVRTSSLSAFTLVQLDT